MTIETSPSTPNTTPAPSTHTFAPFGVSALLAAIWVISAIVRPEATFHLGPLVLPLVPLILTTPNTSSLWPILFGFGLGALVIASLSANGRLDGPALEPFSSATAESVALLIVAGVIGLLLARFTR